MDYRIEHSTVYDYAQEVSASHHLARLAPLATAGQEMRDFTIEIDPLPLEVTTSVDYFGNTVHRFALQELHRRLEVKTRCWVSAKEGTGVDNLVSPPWEEVRDLLRLPEKPDHLHACEFTFASPSIPLNDRFGDYAANAFLPGVPLLKGVRELTRKIHEDFTFDPTATTVTTPVAEVLEEKRGVCQDFAHLQIACLRSLGLPARYVSGYVRTEPPPGQPRLMGADATHAWVSVFCPGLGWTEFDPTNDLVAGESHVRVAFGRDYHDISPIRGTVLGGAGQQLSIGVTMTPVGD